ncbi:MAG: ASCH domain-containing protein [Planctomycetes bacterium]|nr:ASCH domain-containing protein [Planctomycetota bacterium]
MRALSIRQPYAELILRGKKTIEYRSRPTKILGGDWLLYFLAWKLLSNRFLYAIGLSGFVYLQTQSHQDRCRVLI